MVENQGLIICPYLLQAKSVENSFSRGERLGGGTVWGELEQTAELPSVSLSDLSVQICDMGISVAASPGSSI